MTQRESLGERDLDSWTFGSCRDLCIQQELLKRLDLFYSAFGVFTRLVSVHLPSLSIYQTGLSECQIFCSSYSSEKGQDSWIQNGETDCQTCTNREIQKLCESCRDLCIQQEWRPDPQPGLYDDHLGSLKNVIKYRLILKYQTMHMA